MRYGDVALFRESGSVEEFFGSGARRYVTHPEMHYTFMVVIATPVNPWVGGVVLDPGNSGLLPGDAIRCTRELCDMLEWS